MAIVKWDTFAELNSLQDQINSLFSDSAQSRGLQLAPITDIYRDDRSLTVEIHLPSFEEKEIGAAVHNGHLEISAEHGEKDEQKDKRRYVLRESSSSYYRSVPLPKQSDEDNISAHFENGILRVVVPFKELPKPKRIAIGAKSGKK